MIRVNLLSPLDTHTHIYIYTYIFFVVTWLDGYTGYKDNILIDISIIVVHRSVYKYYKLHVSNRLIYLIRIQYHEVMRFVKQPCQKGMFLCNNRWKPCEAGCSFRGPIAEIFERRRWQKLGVPLVGPPGPSRNKDAFGRHQVDFITFFCQPWCWLTGYGYRKKSTLERSQVSMPGVRNLLPSHIADLDLEDLGWDGVIFGIFTWENVPIQ